MRRRCNQKVNWEQGNWVFFLGTGGGRVVTSKQLRQTGGMIIKLGQVMLFIDPGPGALVHARNNCVPLEHVRYLIVTHSHLDHVADINAVTEAILLWGNAQLTVIAPQEVFSQNVLFEYLQRGLKEKLVLRETTFELDGLKLTAFKLRHNVETFGFHLIPSYPHAPKLTLVADTEFFDELVDICTATDVLIINVLFPYKVKIGQHLSLPELEPILRRTQAKQVIITHLGGRYIGKNLKKIATDMSKLYGKQVIFAKDNKLFPFLPREL